jgi:hypothetical protein
MTDRIVPYIVLPLVAAAASLLNLVHFGLEEIMRPVWPGLTRIAWYSAFVLILAAVVVAFRQMETGRRGILIAALVVIVAAGFLPRIVDPWAVAGEVAVDQAEGTPFELAFQMEHLAWSDDIATRTEGNRPWTADEGFAFSNSPPIPISPGGACRTTRRRRSRWSRRRSPKKSSTRTRSPRPRRSPIRRRSR